MTEFTIFYANKVSDGDFILDCLDFDNDTFDDKFGSIHDFLSRAYHTVTAVIEADDLDDVWSKCQNHWSPWIDSDYVTDKLRTDGRYRSMVVGDIIYNRETKTAHVVNRFGFLECFYTSEGYNLVVSNESGKKLVIDRDDNVVKTIKA